MTAESYRQYFSLADDLVYFNHAGVSPIPQRAAQVVAELAQRMARQGAYRYFELEEHYHLARQRAARLLEVEEEGIAFIPNTSTGLSMVGIGVEWQAGDEIITSDQEFPSNRVIWEDVAKRHGVILHFVAATPDGRLPVASILERLSAKTRMIALSSLQYATGAPVDVAALGSALQNHRALLVVDAIQSLGVLHLPARQWQVDVVAADGHKWLLGPEGAGLLYLSAKAQENIAPRLLGWHSLANAGDYSNNCSELRNGARRYEPGSPNLLGIAALGESLELLLEVGHATIGQRIAQVMASLIKALTDRQCRIETPLQNNGLPAGGILVFSHPAWQATALHAALVKNGVVCAARGRGVRLSPHFYQDEEDVQRFLQRLDPILG